MESADKSGAFDTRRKWADLSGVQKLSFLAKLVIFLLTFGFAFPLLMDQEEQE